MLKATGDLGVRLLCLSMSNKVKHKPTFMADPNSPRMLVRVHS